MLKARDMVRSCIVRKIGDGSRTSFWFDPWLPNGVLADMFQVPEGEIFLTVKDMLRVGSEVEVINEIITNTREVALEGGRTHGYGKVRVSFRLLMHGNK